MTDAVNPIESLPGPVSQEAKDMVAAGAAPASVDADAMLKLIQELQSKVAGLEAEKGIPSDPVEAAVKNVEDHVTARAAAMPHVDFSELSNALDKLRQDVTSDGFNVVKLAWEDLTGHAELAYLGQLVRDLGKAVLKKVTG